MPNVLTPNSIKALAKLWGMVICAMLLLLAWLIPHSRINSNLFDLLPKESAAAYPPALVEGYLNTLDQQLVWLISAPSVEMGEAAATQFVDDLTNIDHITHIQAQKSPEDLRAWHDAIQSAPMLMPHNFFEKMADQSYLPWILSQLYSPFSGVSMAEIKHDPLLLTRAFVLNQMQQHQQFSLTNGWVTLTTNDQTWFLIRAEIADDARGMLQRKPIANAIESAKTHLLQNFNSVTLLQSGALFYGNHAATLAEHDITTIGLTSLIGIIVVFYLFFRSWRAIGLTLFTLILGSLFGLTMVLLIDHEIHLITLVMSTSIIGVAIDYTLLFLTFRSLLPNLSGIDTIRTIFSPLVGALISTVLAYVVLLFAPFAGLAQLAIFTITGLLCVFITIVVWFPFTRPLPTRTAPRLLHHITRYTNAWQTQSLLRIGCPILLLIIATTGMLQLKIDDDISALQDLPKTLVSEQHAIGQLLKQNMDQRVVMVTADSPDELITNLEALTPTFDHWVQQGWIEGYQPLPFASHATQTARLTQLKDTLPHLMTQYSSLGITVDEITLPEQPMRLSEWLHSPLSEGWHLLIQTLPNGESAAIVPITHMHNATAIEAATRDHANLHWVDRKGELSTLFGQYRHTMQWLLGAALMIVMIALLSLKGIQNGMISSIVLLLAIALPLGIFGWFGITLNLFGVMALILVLGISIDYVLFFSSRNPAPILLITLMLAALISELTFGLLALSQTNAISDFGLILLLGIATALLLAPLARTRAPSEL
ncbi:MMPL family transporter [Wohlfahrtiimonas chitiniclastica]|uniref:MMPL family transporter n=1 Tax=Wohlfahrtiimonas chitiniclastica TaxID=400946 RepID=UPI0007B697B7|nr:MMPL family transporter [Wohlfahrtiimonas chitiniclastica]KZX36548.1 hypothetical protein A6V30_09160 [Wohlfahrtiimonas chitiniclastica]